MTDYSTITTFVVKFGRHPRHRDAHVYMNSIYQDALPKQERIFTDPATQDTVQDTDKLLRLLQQIITDEMIVPYALETPSPADKYISPLIIGATLQVVTNAGTRRLNKSSLTHALAEAVQQKRYYIEIQIGTHHIYFDPSVELSFTNWQQFSDKPFPTPAAKPSGNTVDPTAIATAVAGAIPHITATDIATAVTTAMAATKTPAATRTTTTTRPASTMWSFNIHALPADVRKRWENKNKEGLITGTISNTPYNSGDLYYLDPPDRLFLSDGTLYIMKDPDDKALFRQPVRCNNDTFSAIRQWYQTFTRHAMDHGFYTHPLWCFRKNKGGNIGFTYGNSTDDDLPDIMEIPLQRMKQPLFCLLQQKDMFPTNSNLVDIVQSCYGDGYKALKAILFKAHPVFYDQPSTMITAYPKQRDTTMLQYYQLFNDYLQLRAFITDVTSSLDNEHELDIFINNAKFHEFLNRVTRDERRLTSLAHKYRGTQLVETLEAYLAAPDSPLRTQRVPPSRTMQPRPSPPDNHRSNGFQSMITRPPAQKPVNQVTSPPGDDLPDEIILTSFPDDTMDTVINSLNTITVPTDPNDRELYHMYSAGIHRVQREPNAAKTLPCIVCGGNHRFAACDVLKNTEFLRNHYITWCTQVQRDMASRNRSFGKQASNIPTAGINFVDTEINNDTDDDSFDPEQDFQQGRP